MNHETTDSYRRAACLDLPLEVSDKYFGANPRTNPFEHRTAKIICRECEARTACLEEAISSPAIFAGSAELTRGGETGTAIREMRRKHFLEGIPAKALAALAISQQVDTPGIDAYRNLRKGKFPDAVLATEWEESDGE